MSIINLEMKETALKRIEESVNVLEIEQVRVELLGKKGQ